MDSVLDRYLNAVRNYASRVAVPGLDVASDPLPLRQVFVPLRVVDYSPLAASPAASRPGDKPPEARRSAPTAAAPPSEKASEVLTQCQRLVILGEPGQGKSTLLRHYASTLVSDPDASGIPILIELGKKRQTIEHSDTPFAWLYQRLPDQFDDVSSSDWLILCEAIKSSRARILLDGFDELHRDARLQLVSHLEMLPPNQIVLTSRPHAYATVSLRDFSVYRLEELSTEQVETLAHAVCRAVAPKFHCDNFDAALEKVLDIAEGQAGTLSRNPLFLSFLCLSAVKKSGEGSLERFPTRPTPLIAECVEALVEWHRTYKAKSSWPQALLAPRVTRILAPLALASFKDATGHITSQSVDQLDDKEKNFLLTHLVAAEFVRRRDENYVFPLETFREYFAALAVAGGADPFAEVRAHLHSPEWERVILYASGVPESGRASWMVRAAPELAGLVKFVGPLLQVLGAMAGKAPARAGGHGRRSAQGRAGANQRAGASSRQRLAGPLAPHDRVFCQLDLEASMPLRSTP